MKPGKSILDKIISSDELAQRIAQWRVLDKKVAFTNGCFDILHQGHIASLLEAAQQGDYLVIGLNSDASVKRLKGSERPINSQDSRALVLAALALVDAVVIFEEDTPRELISKILPDVLVKGGDYKVEQIAGAKEVIANGGKVVINPIVAGFSTTNIIEKFKGKS
ncbi:D-glycero-beta-D-manno-heptose 1-phosphate adenylyltransferase [Flavisolibacter tropicus]|uniref:D-glycero-beta-D-manno-heptose 1-phosphate adenylyltransferase n=1 Tax=Flavisolibacter tropicus TaxID=1492898 RepID=A0A172TQY8_9BACT|nr:D-glycero-beta-D-manno-heptose 1-phosphate adenylyltransferase [Flavisolibacter tropicus]ANE49418.1 D-beta-D-heptose 1-phosphate adenosyltransferase [Flavisolibacter tropicus]